MKQLRHLVAVVDHGHFGRAADACFVTQSSLSASIKELESGLDTILIERTRRTVMVTPLGREVAARARKVLVDVAEIADLVAASGAPLSGPLRLGVIPTIGPFLLPRVLPALRGTYPGLRVYLREAPSAALIDGLAKGDLDLLLLAFPYPLAGMETHVFAEDRFWVAFPRGHRYGRAERLTADDLEGEALLLLEEGHCLRDHALRACGPAADGAAAEFQASSLHTLLMMVDNGLGLTLLPKMAIDAGIAKGTRVAVRPLEGREAVRQIGFAWRPSSPRRDAFATLAAIFRDELATPLPPRRKKQSMKPRPGR